MWKKHCLSSVNVQYFLEISLETELKPQTKDLIFVSLLKKKTGFPKTLEVDLEFFKTVMAIYLT